MPETPASISTNAIDRAAGERDYVRARESLAANDLDGAARWLELAAANEHPAALTELAILYLHGFGRDADPAQAVQLLLRAEAIGGTPETAYLLAQIALGGVVLPRDPQRIDAWMADSARRGYPAALRVAALHFGQRKEAVYQRAAVTCLQRATEARDPVSAALLADRLHAGRGIAPDPVQALDLANQLRAMGIPVELPAADDASDMASGTQAEPPWDALHLLDSRLPEIQRQCDEPEVATCDHLLSDEECRYLIYSGARFLERSKVIHPVTGQPLEFEVRTSQDMAFVPRSDDAGIRILQLRMATMAGFELGNCEPLTLLRYGPGDQYRPHRDYFFPSSPSLAKPGGQRHSTVCTYLNAVQEGGETVFPDKAVTVKPLRGRAVMFRNLLADGSPDQHSLHAGLPVLAGEKWLASCWIRVRGLREF
jgi:hypothetical protein